MGEHSGCSWCHLPALTVCRDQSTCGDSMTGYCLMFLALLRPMQRFLASVSGQILDHEGNPMTGAQVVYTNVGIVDYSSAGQRITEGSGKVYKVRTDKKGSFSLV